MPDCEVVLQTDAGKPIAFAWVYWNKTTLMFTDADGHLFAFRSGSPEAPWNYTTRFRVAIGTDVEIYYTRGAKPVPNARIKEHPEVFYKRKIEVKDASSVPLNNTPVAPKDKRSPDQNTVVAIPQAIVKLPNILINLTKPAELSIWPLLWENPSDAYMMNGIAQAAHLWNVHGTHVSLSVTELGAAPAPAAAVRPRERGLHVTGKIDKAATGVKIQVLDAKGDAVTLRAAIDPASASSPEVKGKLAKAKGDTKEFEADIFFHSAVDAFGPVQIFILSEDETPPILDAFFVELVGLQTALVDDYATNHNGQVRGPLRLEADEVIVVDFLTSPTALDGSGFQSLLRAETRGRRMVAYEFANETRPLNPSAPASPNVLKPQMPMWMAEFQVLGTSLANLTELILFRHFFKFHQLKQGDPGLDIKLQLTWEMELFWSGPDSRAGRGVYHYRDQFNSGATEDVTLHFGTYGVLSDDKGTGINLGPQGEVPNAWGTAPTIIPFPVSNRRLPLVIASGQQRPWGREPGAMQKPAFVIEFQPKIVDRGGGEILRGGNGNLRLKTIKIDDHDIDPGRVEDHRHRLHTPPASDPLIALPEFRILGLNPSRADVEAAIDVIANDVLAFIRTGGAGISAQLQQASAFILLPAWQETSKLVFHKESSDGGAYYSHFFVNPTLTQRYNSQAFAFEHAMPEFGPPHGYGLAQRDPPNAEFVTFGCPGDDIVWNFVIGIRAGIVELMDKGRLALLAFTHPPAAASSAAFNGLTQQQQRALFQRDAIRRYNGNHEFQFDGHHWMVDPTDPTNDYPNQVLDPSGATDVNYGSAPVALQPANFGPGI